MTQLNLTQSISDFSELSKLATRALLYEATVNPKPGLVDPTSHKSHPDMDIFTFINSSISLDHYFEQCVNTSLEYHQSNPVTIFNKIRKLGIQAERKMLESTHNVNTHKGAIFSLGILVSATTVVATNNVKFTPYDIHIFVKKMLQSLIKNDLEQKDMINNSNLTNGEKQFKKFGKTGIRGEASSGFPSIFDHSLPFLSKSNGTLNERLLDTLLLITTVIDDSNLIKRANNDLSILSWIKTCAQEFHQLGGSQTTNGFNYLVNLNHQFDEQNLSLGGSADILISTIFIALVFETI